MKTRRKRSSIERSVLFSGITAALVCMGSAHAQSTEAGQAASPRDLDRITVTTASSRIEKPGFDAPSPTTHITPEELRVASRHNVAAVLNEMPQFRASNSPQTQGTNQGGGAAPVDLRGLGAARTLVLLDGRRFVGDNDLNTVPTILVRDVDIVTGGASAAWGSGAVGGVVNVSIDDTLVGAKFDLRSGISDRSDSEEQAFSFAAGGAFADGRGHAVFGAELYNTQGIIPKTDRENAGRWLRIANPATPGSPASVTTTADVGMSNALRGGIITSGVLRNMGFNPDGSLRQPDLGRIVGANMIGGEGPSDDDHSPLTTPQRNYSMMGRVTFDINDTTKLTADLRTSRASNGYLRFGDHDRGNLQISADNAFLRPEIRDQILAAGQTGFTMGRFNDDFALPTLDFERRNTQATVAVDGALSEAWTFNAYVSQGEFSESWVTPGFILGRNYANAVDSVIDPVSGNAVCRIALTDPGTDCVPINLFGVGAPSAAATKYVTGTPWRKAATQLTLGGFTVQGDAFQMPAGVATMAMGIEARRESINQRVGEDDLALAHRMVNYAPLKGEYFVREAFVEGIFPLVQSAGILNNTELNAAYRYSDYDTTGGMSTWKVGLTNEFVPGLKGRFTRSQDIRSPNLSEMFTTGGVGWDNVVDPTNGASIRGMVFSGGNPDLSQEEAQTLTAGFSWSPTSIRGLSMSLDYFSTEIEDVITNIGTQDFLNRCFNGNQTLCAAITRDAQGNLEYIRRVPVNLARYSTDGVDLDVSYRTRLGEVFPALDGGLTLRLLATWTNSLETDDGVSKIEYVGSQGDVFGGLGVPRVRATAIAMYEGERFAGSLRTRYSSAGKFNNTLNLTNNDIGTYTYIDLGLRAKLGDAASSRTEVYANVNNLADKAPPIGSNTSPFYDVVGRYYQVGLRMSF